MLASLGDNTDSHTNQRCRRVFLVTDSTRGPVASDEEGGGGLWCRHDTIRSKVRARWLLSPVNEATVRQLLEQEESEDEMSSAIDDTDSDPDYDPSGFRDQPHTLDL
ncbi:hypothetical protein J6590_101533, partial [Homalodisca vitripennis]